MQVPTSQLLSEYLKNTRDASDANRVTGKQRMDHHYTFLLSQANNHITERKKYGNLKGVQRSYLLPIDYLPNGLKMVRVYVNDKWSSPLEIVLPAEHWAQLTANLTFDDEPTHCTIKNEQGRMYLELDGVPLNDASENLEITYLGYQDPLIFPDDYTAGTISIQYDKPYLNGIGTAFTRAMERRFARINNGKDWYEIVNYGSDHLLSLLHNWDQVDQENVSYVIAEVPRLPHEFHYSIMYGAVADYYRPKDAAKAKEFQSMYDRDVILIQRRYQNKTQGSVKPGIPVQRNHSRVPYNYPNSTITRL